MEWNSGRKKRRRERSLIQSCIERIGGGCGRRLKEAEVDLVYGQDSYQHETTSKI